MVITITKSGYIKSLPLTTYRAQQRGGRGVTGMDMKDGDYIEHLFVTSSHDYLLFFSNRGKVYRSKVYELPEASRTAKGRALVNVLPLRDGERIQSVLSTRDFTEGRYVVFATKRGIVKKTELLAYNTPIKADGIIAINIRDDDELVSVRRTSGDDDILMVSRKGQAVRFNESDARAMGRDTSGVRGMNVDQPDNEVLVMDVARDDQELLVVTENGYGKRTSIAEYRKTKRGAMGVGTIKLTDAKGALAGAIVVREHDELVFISQSGMVQRTAVRGISRYGRLAQGVRLMNMKEDDLVSAVALDRRGLGGGRRTGATPMSRSRSIRRPAARRSRSSRWRRTAATPARRGSNPSARGARTRATAPAEQKRCADVGDVRYDFLTRERRWSESAQVLAGPWRCPAARPDRLAPSSESKPGHPCAGRRTGPTGKQNILLGFSVQLVCAKGALSRRPSSLGGPGSVVVGQSVEMIRGVPAAQPHGIDDGGTKQPGRRGGSWARGLRATVPYVDACRDWRGSAGSPASPEGSRPAIRTRIIAG